MDQIEVRYEGRLGLLRSASRNMDGSVTLDYGRKAVVGKEEWMRALKKRDPKMKEELWKWTQMLPSVNAPWIDRWGFLCGNREQTEGVNDRRYEVAHLLLASGDRHGWRRNQYYASSVMTGGPHTFWAIDFYTLEATDFGDISDPGSPVTSDIEEADSASAPTFEIRFDERRQMRYMVDLDRWFLRNLDKPKLIRGPGQQGPSCGGQQFKTDIPVACFSPKGQCTRAALANALFLLDGRSTTREMLSKGRVRTQSLAHAGTGLERNMRSFALRNVDIPADTPQAYWLSQQEEGIFIVSLDGRDLHNESTVHVIVIDAARRLVMDCAERTALKIKMPIFDFCVGDGVRFKRFLEIKRLVRQAKGKRKRKAHKMNKEKQRALRIRKREEKREAVMNRPRCKKRIVLSDDD